MSQTTSPHCSPIGGVPSAARRRKDPDAQLLARCQGAYGDERREAFEQLHMRLHESIYAACLRVLHNPTDAQDATQEAFCTLYRKLDSFRFESRVSSWAYRIAVHTSIDLRRRGGSGRSRSLDALRERSGVDGTLFDVPDDSRDRPFAVARRREERVVVRSLVAGLSPKLRQILVMRYSNGLSNIEISGLLNIPPGTVKSRLARARRAVELGLGSGRGEPLKRSA